MSRAEQLEKIVARCLELLAVAEKGSPEPANCSGPAEAGWVSTVLAIKQLKEMPLGFHRITLEKLIVAAWEDALL